MTPASTGSARRRGGRAGAGGDNDPPTWGGGFSAVPRRRGGGRAAPAPPLLEGRVGGRPHDPVLHARHQRPVLLRLCESRLAVRVGSEGAPRPLAVRQIVEGGE